MHSSALQLCEHSFNSENCENDTTAGLTKRNSAFLTARILPVFYPQGGAFFLEGQSATGVFLLRTGRVKESVISSRGETAIVRVAGPGVIRGGYNHTPQDGYALVRSSGRSDLFLLFPHFLHHLLQGR